jgi:hypothetical protein
VVESAIAAAFVRGAVDDGDGNGNSGRRSMAADNGNVRFRWHDDNNILMGGAMRKYLLANFILLYLREASEIWEVARKSPGSRQEVARKLPRSRQEVASKLPGSNQEVARKSCLNCYPAHSIGESKRNTLIPIICQGIPGRCL